MKAIVCQNSIGCIGDKGRLIWHCKAELQHFARLTSGCTLLVGYNTAQSLPTLKGRTLIVDLRDALLDTANIDWCIGGAKTYAKYAHLFTELHISTIIDNAQIGDTYLPTLNLLPNCKTFKYTFYDTKRI